MSFSGTWKGAVPFQVLYGQFPTEVIKLWCCRLIGWKPYNKNRLG